jgi:hypothetical protein
VAGTRTKKKRYSWNQSIQLSGEYVRTALVIWLHEYDHRQCGKPTDIPTIKRKSGLAYDIFEKQNLNEVIFAFRGADSKKDYLDANLAVWPFSIQYTQAKKAF